MFWRTQQLPNAAPRGVKPIGAAAGARVFSGALTRRGGLAAVAFPRERRGEFPVSSGRNAEAAPKASLLQTNEIYVLEMFAMVVAVGSLGEQLAEKRMISFITTRRRGRG